MIPRTIKLPRLDHLAYFVWFVVLTGMFTTPFVTAWNMFSLNYDWTPLILIGALVLSATWLRNENHKQVQKEVSRHLGFRDFSLPILNFRRHTNIRITRSGRRRVFDTFLIDFSVGGLPECVILPTTAVTFEQDEDSYDQIRFPQATYRARFGAKQAHLDWGRQVTVVSSDPTAWFRDQVTYQVIDQEHDW